MLAQTNFSCIQESTPEDWRIIGGEFMQFAKSLPDRVLAHLTLLEGDFGGFPISRYSHCLQAATRALRDGRDDEYVVCALLHDIGDTLSSFHHAEIATTVPRPFVREANHWMVQIHSIFQVYNFFHHIRMDRNMRDQFLGHAHYTPTEEFIALYDDPGVDSTAGTSPISEFEPLLRRVMAQPRDTIYKQASETAT